MTQHYFLTQGVFIPSGTRSKSFAWGLGYFWARSVYSSGPSCKPQYLSNLVLTNFETELPTTRVTIVILIPNKHKFFFISYAEYIPPLINSSADLAPRTCQPCVSLLLKCRLTQSLQTCTVPVTHEWNKLIESQNSNECQIDVASLAE